MHSRAPAWVDRNLRRRCSGVEREHRRRTPHVTQNLRLYSARFARQTPLPLKNMSQRAQRGRVRQKSTPNIYAGAAPNAVIAHPPPPKTSQAPPAGGGPGVGVVGPRVVFGAGVDVGAGAAGIGPGVGAGSSYEGPIWPGRNCEIHHVRPLCSTNIMFDQTDSQFPGYHKTPQSTLGAPCL